VILTDLADDKRLVRARPLAIFATTSDPTAAIDFVKILAEKYPSIPSLVYGIAFASRTTFFFDEPKEIIIEKLYAIRASRGKTAPKVIVKMLYERMIKLHDLLDNLRTCQKTCDAQSYFTAYEAPELTFESMVDQDYFKKSTHVIKITARKVYRVATRVDVTPEILQQAWDLYQTYIIMKS